MLYKCELFHKLSKKFSKYSQDKKLSLFQEILKNTFITKILDYSIYRITLNKEKSNKIQSSNLDDIVTFTLMVQGISFTHVSKLWEKDIAYVFRDIKIGCESKKEYKDMRRKLIKNGDYKKVADDKKLEVLTSVFNPALLGLKVILTKEMII